MRALASLVLVATMFILGVKLAAAPLHAVYTADECTRAYSRAQTRADSGRIDLHPYKGARPGVKHRCLEVRARQIVGTVDIPGLVQPR